MVDITVPAAAPLATIPNVELMRAGQWAISTGLATFTPDDLASAVAAMDCPAVRRPVLKLGHVDPRFDGEPAVGWIGNMGTADGGATLVGDYTSMPGWLGDVIASAYPDRSIEGQYDYRCQVGHLHPFVITGVALLGVTPPGVGNLQSLQDVAALYGVAASSPATGVPVTVTVRASTTDVSAGAMVALLPAEQDAQRLAVDGGEPADQLHVTLWYLGKAADYSADAQTHLLDLVTGYVADQPPVMADGSAVSVFNPTSDDRDTCIVLGLTGAGLDEAHNKVAAAIEDYGADTPDQHTPWVPHVTLIYTDDLTMVAGLVDRTGPVTFDRVRVAFGGEHTDIPLTATSPSPVAASEDAMPNPRPPKVAAAVSTEDVRRAYYDDANWSYWITEIQLDPLQLIVCDDNSGKYYRVPVTITGDDTFTFGPAMQVVVTYVDKPGPDVEQVAAARLVYASRAESRPGTPAATASPKHSTATSDGTWDKSANVKNLPSPMPVATAKATYGWYDDTQVDAGELPKTACKLPHHEVSADGGPGAANLTACSAAVGALNGAHGGVDIPDAERQATYDHLAAHLKAGNQEPPELKASTPPAPPRAAGAPPKTPAAEPETKPEPKEDHVSTILSDVRSRLGLPDDADDAAVTAAVLARLDERPAITDPEPKPATAPADPVPAADADLVAASAENKHLADQVRQLTTKVGLLTEQVESTTGELAASRAAKAADAKASLLDDAQRHGKFRPADREAWATRYDRSPEVTAEVLAAIQPGTAVPVNATGIVGNGEPTSDEGDPFAHLFSEPLTTVKGA
jgi:2'-5' RNA ligase